MRGLGAIQSGFPKTENGQLLAALSQSATQVADFGMGSKNNRMRYLSSIPSLYYFTNIQEETIESDGWKTKAVAVMTTHVDDLLHSFTCQRENSTWRSS